MFLKGSHGPGSVQIKERRERSPEAGLNQGFIMAELQGSFKKIQFSGTTPDQLNQIPWCGIWNYYY